MTLHPFKVIAVALWLIGFSLLFMFQQYAPVTKLLIASLGLLVFVKGAALLWQVASGKKWPRGLAFLVFMFGWPGVRVDGFLKREKEPMPITGERFLESWLAFLLGVGIVIVSGYVGRGESTVWNYASLYGFLLIFHLGLVEVMTDGLRLLGYTPQSQFDRPLFATSLRDFWSFRWNLSFVDMNKIFFLEPLRKTLPKSVLIFLIFAFSGVLHEIALSYPVNAGWGLPFGYFIVQGMGVLLEQKIKLPRAFVLAWIILPSPILFHPPFVNTMLGLLGAWIASISDAVTMADVWKYGLLLGGALHLCVLMASVQVPGQLQWREELGRLRPLNRKVFWTYGIYIFCIIVILSAVSFYLSGKNSATDTIWLWPAFIAAFWWARIGIDFLYMSHSDWPVGPLFAVGHVCLSTLFLTLCVLYSGLCWISFRGGLA